jgi:hypothetical protein
VASFRSVVQTEDIADLKIASLQSGFQQSLIKGNSPLYTVYSPDSEELGVLKRFDVVNELNLGIHHPDVRLGKIGN